MLLSAVSVESEFVSPLTQWGPWGALVIMAVILFLVYKIIKKKKKNS